MRLRIIRTSGEGSERERIIGRETLVIGRGDECDWVLPDPERTLSKRHCEVAFQGAVFVLRDTSTNGVFVNGAAEPLGRGNAVVLKHGDSFRAAAFGFRVEVLAADNTQGVFAGGPSTARADFAGPGSAIDAVPATGPGSFDAFDLPPVSGPDPLGQAGTFERGWGEADHDSGFSGSGFGAFDAPAPGGPRAQIPDDLDLIPLGAPAPDDPWTTPGLSDAPAQSAELRQLASKMIEALLQLERQQEAVLRLLGLGHGTIPAISALPSGSGETIVAHLCDIGAGQGGDTLDALTREDLQDLLLEQFHIEGPVIPWPAPPKRLIRVSGQVYNCDGDYEKLGHALRALRI